MASQIQLAFYWISNCANCQSGNRASRLVRWLAGWLAGWLLVLLDTATNLAAATRVHRACTPGRAIALPPNRYFYTNSDNRLHNFAVPSNTNEITDGFSNGPCSWFYAFAENAPLVRPFIFFVKPSRVRLSDNLFCSVQ